jgi:hypothetical protein
MISSLRWNVQQLSHSIKSHYRSSFDCSTFHETLSPVEGSESESSTKPDFSLAVFIFFFHFDCVDIAIMLEAFIEKIVKRNQSMIAFVPAICGKTRSDALITRTKENTQTLMI